MEALSSVSGRRSRSNHRGDPVAHCATEKESYYGQWLHLYRPSGSLSRFPMYDNIGSARGLLDASGTATDWYELDTFGGQVSSSGTTPNPYRFGGAWGYITDPSGFLQLGQRFYWPEVGRFIHQDPARAEENLYAYVNSRPTRLADPTGLINSKCLREAVCSATCVFLVCTGANAPVDLACALGCTLGTGGLGIGFCLHLCLGLTETPCIIGGVTEGIIAYRDCEATGDTPCSCKGCVGWLLGNDSGGGACDHPCS